MQHRYRVIVYPGLTISACEVTKGTAAVGAPVIGGSGTGARSAGVAEAGEFCGAGAGAGEPDSGGGLVMPAGMEASGAGLGRSCVNARPGSGREDFFLLKYALITSRAAGAAAAPCSPL